MAVSSPRCGRATVATPATTAVLDEPSNARQRRDHARAFPDRCRVSLGETRAPSLNALGADRAHCMSATFTAVANESLTRSGRSNGPGRIQTCDLGCGVRPDGLQPVATNGNTLQERISRLQRTATSTFEDELVRGFVPRLVL